MFSFMARSAIQKMITLFFVSVISFLVVYLAPGKPSQVDPLNPKFTPEMVERFRKQFHLDEPLYTQYFYFYRDLFKGTSISWKDNEPVRRKMWDRFKNSLLLFVVGTILTWTLSFPIGIRSALFRGGTFDRTATFLSYFFISIPGFFFAYMLIILVVRAFHVPVIGMATFGLANVPWYREGMDRVWHLLLPSVLGATGGIAILSRYVRSQMLEVESQDYVRTAKAKGVPEERVHYKHALRNALLPFVTMFGLVLPGLIGGSVIIEYIFSWPGMGRMAYEAILARDYPIILAENFIAAVLVLVGTFISDVLYMVVDPEDTAVNQTETEIVRKEAVEKPLAPRESRWREFWRLFRKNHLAFVGLLIFVLFFFSALAGLVLTSGPKPLFDPAIVRLEEKLRPPLSIPHRETLAPGAMPRLGLYLFGTDDLGRDVFSRMMQGAWVSLTVGFVAVGISVFIGIILGGISGYYGQNAVTTDQVIAAVVAISGIGFLLVKAVSPGVLLLTLGILSFIFSGRLRKRVTKRPEPAWSRALWMRAIGIDTLIMRFVDIMLCFPSFFLILTVVALLPPSIYNIMIVIGLTSWMGTTRFVRAEFLSLRELDFVMAARALGVSNGRIIFRHMVPNAIGPVLVSATIGIASAILTESALSFLGLGVPPPHATWGNILSDGKNYIFDAPWLTFIPGIAILIVVLSFNLFGEGLRDVLNPRLRERT